MRRFVSVLIVSLWTAGCQSGGGTGGQGSYPVPAPPAASDTTDRFQLVLAEVGGIQITGADLRNHMSNKAANDEALQRHMGNPDILQVGLASLIDQLTWAEMAKRHGIKLDHEDAMKVRSLEAQLLATHYVAEVVQMKAVPSREVIEAYYREHQQDFLNRVRVAVRHILVPTQAEAENLLGQLRGGADFIALAKQYSQDTNTRDLGGALGFVESNKPVMGIGNDPEFVSAVLPLEPGQLTVTKSRLGWHVVKVEKREGGGMIPVDQVYEEISKGLTSQIFGQVYNEALTQARQEINARYITENFNKFSGVADNPGRLFQIAESQTDPLSSIELFRRVSFDFPDYKRSAEAQFMIGYLYLTQLNKKDEAKSAFKRLQDVFPNTPWRKGGDYLLKHLDDPDPKALGSPRDILTKAQS